MSFPSYNTFIASQSECVDVSQEDIHKWNQYRQYTHPKYRSVTNKICRPINQYYENPPDDLLNVVDASAWGIDFDIVRNNAITSDIGVFPFCLFLICNSLPQQY